MILIILKSGGRIFLLQPQSDLRFVFLTRPSQLRNFFFPPAFSLFLHKGTFVLDTLSFSSHDISKFRVCHEKRAEFRVCTYSFLRQVRVFVRAVDTEMEKKREGSEEKVIIVREK